MELLIIIISISKIVCTNLDAALSGCIYRRVETYQFSHFMSFCNCFIILGDALLSYFCMSII